jgi:hypothetical protein
MYLYEARPIRYFNYLVITWEPAVIQACNFGNIYYIPVNITLFPAGGVCCLQRNISAHVCHIQIWFLVTSFLSYKKGNAIRATGRIGP